MEILRRECKIVRQFDGGVSDGKGSERRLRRCRRTIRKRSAEGECSDQAEERDWNELASEDT
jgi:hypothetical protein